MDKAVLQKWLKSGYVENGVTYPTRKGVPQGGIISPTISNMVLDGLEEAVHSAVPRRRRINFVRYADDFIITGKSKKILKEVIQPVVEKFLAVRGLELSVEKRWSRTSNTDSRSSGKPFASLAENCTSRRRMREFIPSCKR